MRVQWAEAVSIYSLQECNRVMRDCQDEGGTSRNANVADAGVARDIESVSF